MNAMNVEILKTSNLYDVMQRVKAESIQKHGKVLRLTKEDMHSLRDKKKEAIRSRKKSFDINMSNREYRVSIV